MEVHEEGWNDNGRRIMYGWSKEDEEKASQHDVAQLEVVSLERHPMLERRLLGSSSGRPNFAARNICGGLNLSFEAMRLRVCNLLRHS